MTNNQVQTKVGQNNSTIKWTALTIGGSIVMIACLAFVFVLIRRFLNPQNGDTLRHMIPALNGIPGGLPVNTAVAGPISHPESIFNTMGDPNAPVKIIEYADFQCPYCRRYWQETEPQIINTYVATGKVFYEYRSVGAFIGPDSASAAQAAYCAGDQSKFWEYHDVLYSNWTGENVGDFAPDKLQSYAATIGLDTKTFDDCLNRSKYANQIEQDVVNAKANGIHSTPSFLINNKLVEGAQPFTIFQQAIESALKDK
jgi:protein-disulfide isomerase